MPSAKKEKSRNVVVRDDWEDDDDDEEDDNPVVDGERNKQIWNEAYVRQFRSHLSEPTCTHSNSREFRPMPSVVMSRGSTTSSNLPLNEPPAMRILKRPSPSSNFPSNINITIGESLQDREARYIAARERIFRTSTSEDDPTEGTMLQYNFGEMPSPSSSTISSQAIREPRGPTFGDGTNSSSIKGFHRRVDRSKNTVSSPSKTPSEDTSL